MRALWAIIASAIAGPVVVLAPSAVILGYRTEPGSVINYFLHGLLVVAMSLGLLLLLEWKTRSRLSRTFIPVALAVGLWTLNPIVQLAEAGDPGFVEEAAASSVVPQIASLAELASITSHASRLGVYAATLILVIAALMEWESRRYTP